MQGSSRKKGEGEIRISNTLLNATPYNRIPTPAYSVAEVGRVLHAWGQCLFPARCPSKTHRVGRACSTPSIITPPKPKGWSIKDTHARIQTQINTPILVFPEPDKSCPLGQIQTPARELVTPPVTYLWELETPLALSPLHPVSDAL